VIRDSARDKSENSVASLALGCAVLTVLLLIAGVGFGYYGSQKFGSAGLQAAMVAGGICWLAGCLALAISYAGRQIRFELQATLASVVVRLGLPMLSGLLLQSTAPALADSGVFVMILGNYLIMLVAETLLSLKFVSPASKSMTKAA
jgi:hypothetical protein